MGQEILVSVIVPIYNVAPYIDRCVESIINQTYCNLEILLVNDGSTDASLEKCLDWRRKDNRIIVVDKRNEGLGPARNYGICAARGEYIVSVDPDDWVDLHYVEVLLSAAIRHDADLVISNNCIYTESTKRITVGSYATTAAIMQTVDGKIRYMHESPMISFFGKIYRRSFLINNRIYQPNTAAQDLAVSVQTIACANKIVRIQDVLYYYWEDRKTSITNVRDKAYDFLEVFKYSVSEMKRLNLFESYKEGQLAVLSMHASAMLKRHVGKDDYWELKKEYVALFDQEFPDWKQKVWMNWAVFGSFNTVWTAQVVSQSYICTPVQYSFTSLISQFLGKKSSECSIKHENKVRERAVKSDITGMQKPLELKEEVGILIDFMEERCDILETEDGVFITDSEAFRECNKTEIKIKRVIISGSAEHMKLWKEACLKFIQWIENSPKKVPVYLLKMRMAKGYGIGQIEEWFENQEEIKRINSMLDEMDDFFLKHYNAAVYVQGEDELYYSQTAQRYGCVPYHLNQELYRDISKNISI